jgi:hypothetical protein
LRNNIRREVEEQMANAMINAGAGGITAMHITSDGKKIDLQAL